MSTLTYTGTLHITRCWCGIELAVPQSLWEHAQSDSKNHIYCPLGHRFIYQENEATRQKERADALARRLQSEQTRATWLRDQLGASERSAAAYRGHLTRLRNKIADGVCPVDGCRRNFANVKGHIARMHPDWAHEHPEALS